jgi:hypothetical protein
MKQDLYPLSNDRSSQQGAATKREKAAREAMARRRLEQYREEKALREQLYDAFLDERDH